MGCCPVQPHLQGQVQQGVGHLAVVSPQGEAPGREQGLQEGFEGDQFHKGSRRQPRGQGAGLLQPGVAR
jgi:hypothetical protein